MTRKHLFHWFALRLIFCGSFAAQSRLSTKHKPNILFLAVDDMRPDFGAYGSQHIHSPKLDSLPQQGVTFDRAYCQQAVCPPSRSSLLTGRRLDTTKVWELFTHFRTALSDVVRLPQHFKNNDYCVKERRGYK